MIKFYSYLRAELIKDLKVVKGVGLECSNQVINFLKTGMVADLIRVNSQLNHFTPSFILNMSMYLK